MIWDKQDCPLCGKILRTVHSDYKDPIHTLSCVTGVDVPYDLDYKYSNIKSSYHKDQLESHFEVEYQNYKPVYQMVKIYPFIIKGYDNCFNIYKYDNDLFQHFITEVPPFKISWHDKQSLIKKLSTYTLFS